MTTLLLTGAISLVIMMASCVGSGLCILMLLRILTRLSCLEALVWAFVLGFGFLGWVVFFVGLAGALQTMVLMATMSIGLPGLFLLRRVRAAPIDPFDHWTWVLVIGWGILIFFDLLEAFSPPADGDSLAYHFALPKQFLTAEKIVFVPRAVDGAVPLLMQMTYMVAIAVGGETALTLWTWTTGVALSVVTFVVVRPYLNRNWSLATALVVASTPAVLYGGGSGQIEPRLAVFVLLGSVALARGIETREIRYIVLAGLLFGFCMASKFTGLFLAAAAGILLLIFLRSPKVLTAFAVATLAAGWQWYGWNWWHTGDPLFPVFHSMLGFSDNEFWTAEQNVAFTGNYIAAERPLPRSLGWLLYYPFWVTLTPIAAVDAGRTGLGPYAWVILPFALAGIWRMRLTVPLHPLFMPALIAVVFYVTWFLFGASQRVRHFLVIWPIIVICLTVAAQHFVADKKMQRPLIAAIGAVVAIQLLGQGVFGLSYARYVFSDESRDEFLRRTVAFYDFVDQTEREMTPMDRVLVDARQLIYLFDKPTFYHHALDQSQIVARNSAKNPARFLQELRSEKITLLLIANPVGKIDTPNELARGAEALVEAGCAMPVKSMTANAIDSRTLDRSFRVVSGTLYRLIIQGCAYL